MPRSLGSVTPPFDKLCLSEYHRNLIKEKYENKLHSEIFFTDEVVSRNMALEFGLDEQLRTIPGCKWSKCWVNKWSATGRRILMQCGCGYDTHARQVKEKEHSTYTTVGAKSSEEWQRIAPYDYTGCLVHVDLTFVDGVLRRLTGYLTHNDACITATMKRVPSIPLHPHVKEIALAQLCDGASITSVEMKNIEYFTKGLYIDQDSMSNRFRYQIVPHDFSRIYRLHSKAQGVDVCVAAEKNIHSWLDEQSKAFRRDFQEATFFYKPRILEEDRFILCLATKDMDEAAWKYCHHKQLILDGTFGVCSSKLLLFIAMAVDNNRKGIPIALFFFSAPSGNRATQAGYDSVVLKQVLKKWHEHLGVRDGEAFTPFVCVTDTDTKERLALKSIWPTSIEILCKFHVSQCWSNKRSSLLKRKRDDPWMDALNDRLKNLEDQLLESNVYENAMSLVRKERSILKGLSDRFTEANGAVAASTAVLNYLESYWFTTWASWSRKGKELASEKTGIPVGEILTTTNHLENFNGVMKHKYIPNYQHSQVRLRYDVLVHYMVKEILPHIYSRRGVKDDIRARLISQFPDTIAKQTRSTNKPENDQSNGEMHHLAWYEADEARDIRAKCIISQSLLHSTKFREDEVIAICISSSRHPGDLLSMPTLAHYFLTAHISGAASCTCKDWLTHFGACKHLRALRMEIEEEKARGDPYYTRFHFPSSKAEALEIPENNKNLYDENMTRQRQTGIQSSNTSDDLELSSDRECPSVIMGDQANCEIAEEVDNGRTDGSHVLDGIHRHIQGQIDHSFRQVLPRLHGLLQNLKQIGGKIEQTADLQEFYVLLHDCEDIMATLGLSDADERLESSFSSGEHLQSIDTADTSRYPLQSSARPHSQNIPVLGPVLERRQKRRRLTKTF